MREVTFIGCRPVVTTARGRLQAPLGLGLGISPQRRTTVRFPLWATTRGRGSRRRSPYPSSHDQASADPFLSVWVVSMKGALLGSRRTRGPQCGRASPVWGLSIVASTGAPDTSDQHIDKLRRPGMKLELSGPRCLICCRLT